MNLKQAASNFYKREYNVDIDPNTEVAIMFGTKIGLVELPLALMNENDLMLLPDPGYPGLFIWSRTGKCSSLKLCHF